MLAAAAMSMAVAAVSVLVEALYEIDKNQYIIVLTVFCLQFAVGSVGRSGSVGGSIV